MSDDEEDGFTPSSPTFMPSSPPEDEDGNNQYDNNYNNEQDDDEYAPSSPPPASAAEWQAFQDDDGRTYYYNESTGESSWEVPEGFLQDESANPPSNDDVEDENDGETPAPDGSQTPPPDDEWANNELEQDEEGGATVEAGSGNSWQAFQDDEGRTYYYNEVTGVTQWDRPESMPPTPQHEETAEHEQILEQQQDQQQQHDDQSEQPNTAQEEEKKEDVPVDPVEQAKEALNEVDAILEPSCASHVAELVKELGPNEGFSTSIPSLTNGYHGMTAICGLLAQWTMDLSRNTRIDKPDAAANQAADKVRAIASDMIHNIVMDKFRKEGEDNIFKLSKKEIVFLDEMTDSPRWRRLLIDLSAKHKDSALLMFVLNKISSKGYHREIAERINQSDYFDVFHQLLVSEVTMIGKAGVGSHEDLGGLNTSDTIGKNLRKICTATAYTYLHSMKTVQDLIQRTIDTATQESDNVKKQALLTAVQKWERLKEDLEATLLAGGGESSAPARKRRIDIGLCLSELHLTKRRCLALDESQVDLQKDKFRDVMDDAVMQLQKRHALGMPIDVVLVDKLLRVPDDKNLPDDDYLLYVGKQLIDNPLTVDALITILFKPGSTVVKSPMLIRKCSAAMARATVAARRATYGSQDLFEQIKQSRPKTQPMSDNEDSSSEQQDKQDANVTLQEELDFVAKQLIEGSELCEQVGNMVSFVVLDDPNPKTLSVGRRLSAVCIQSAPVARGVMYWSLELVKGPEFSTSAAYPTLTPCILSLARIISRHHPFCRRDVVQLAFTILTLPADSEMSYQKLQTLKDQCLRLLLWQAVQGQALDVFYGVASRFSQGLVAFDTATVRYFMAGALGVIQIPLSVSFAKCFAHLLQTKLCEGAINSAYFDLEYKKSAKRIIIEIVKIASSSEEMKSATTEKERKSIMALKDTYKAIL